MKIAVLVDYQNFNRYSNIEKAKEEFELIFLGNKNIDENDIIASKAEMIIADPMIPLTRHVIENMPNLKLIQSQAVGYNLFDIKAARENGVTVTNCAKANATAVAEQTILLMLSVLKKVKELDRMVFEGKQSEAKERCFANGLSELNECHVGIIGLGTIGRKTAELLRAFGCHISYYNRTQKKCCDFEPLPFKKLLSSCDIISLHLAMTPETTGIIGKKEFDIIKPGGILINTSRGEIIDQDALCDALISGKLAGAGLDVLSPEPVTISNPVLKLPKNVQKKVVLSPHVAGLTNESFRKYFEIIWENAHRLSMNQELLNVVN